MALSLRPWLLAARPRTLPAALAPVVLGSSIAFASGAFVAPAAAVCFLFALLMQVTSNYANDYFDYVQGTDTAERIGPTRAVASGQVSPRAMLAATVVVTVLALCVGLLLVRYGGWWLVAVGVASALCAIAYTGGPYPLGYNGLGDVFAFLFFGPVAVGGTYYVQAGQLSAPALWAGAGIGLMIANILVVNNYRDAQSDACSGKRTLVVRFGRRFARRQYALSLCGALAVPLILWLGYGFTPWVLLAWGILPLALRLMQRLRTADALLPGGGVPPLSHGEMQQCGKMPQGGEVRQHEEARHGTQPQGRAAYGTPHDVYSPEEAAGGGILSQDTDSPYSVPPQGGAARHGTQPQAAACGVPLDDGGVAFGVALNVLLGKTALLALLYALLLSAGLLVG